jgi:hypothetical protein
MDKRASSGKRVQYRETASAAEPRASASWKPGGYGIAYELEQATREFGTRVWNHSKQVDFPHAPFVSQKYFLPIGIMHIKPAGSH